MTVILSYSPPALLTKNNSHPQILNKSFSYTPQVKTKDANNKCSIIIQESDKNKDKRVSTEMCSSSRWCCGRCGRRGLLGASILLPSIAFNNNNNNNNSTLSSSSYASALPADPTGLLSKIHPPRPDWYEELYALAMNSSMKSYEAEVAGYKSQIFANLRGKASTILEVGVGTGPNFKYYAGNNDVVDVVGVDPNLKMEKYAQAAALSSGIPLQHFEFIQGVGEALPVSDASVDAVVGTLVLCSVKDVDATLQEIRRVLKPGGLYLFVEHVAAKDGTFLKFVQGVLDPLQQTVADGCHLTRNTGTSISAAGFSSYDINMAFLSTQSIFSPHVYGIACK